MPSRRFPLLVGSLAEQVARTSVRDGVSFDGPVLLVDDTVRTRWTVTVASALLAEVGASQVMPLAVHQLP